MIENAGTNDPWWRVNLQDEYLIDKVSWGGILMNYHSVKHTICGQICIAIPDTIY